MRFLDSFCFGVEDQSEANGVVASVVTNAFLFKANLKGADLRGACLDQASLDQATMPDGSKYSFGMDISRFGAKGTPGKW